MKPVRHILIPAAVLLVLLGIPVVTSDAFAGFTGRSGADAVSSATVALDQPSGKYLVFINTRLHTDEENLETWIDFFEGREISYLFEDISCIVAEADVTGLEMARSLQSRLPENQMKVRTEDATLMISKADNGRFDIIIMSVEMADIISAGTLLEDEANIVIELEGAA